MALSARNQLPGIIQEVRLGEIMAHVVVGVGDNIVESVITRTSAEELEPEGRRLGTRGCQVDRSEDPKGLSAERLVLGGVTITHPDRVISEAGHVTKGQLAEYYAGVAALIHGEVLRGPRRRRDIISRLCGDNREGRC